MQKKDMRGIVKWFKSEKGYGFIKCDEIENDIFVHYSDVQMKGFKALEEGQTVIFDYDDEKEKAVNVRKVTEEEPNAENKLEEN